MKHIEWFAGTLEEAQRVIKDWCDIAASPLYKEDRILSLKWSLIVGYLSQVTASNTSQHLKKIPSRDLIKVSGVLGPSQKETLVTSPSFALPPRKTDKSMGES